MDLVTTKTGDKGTTGLFTGEREKKNHKIFDCLGTMDELVSHLGLLRIYGGSEQVEFLQKDIFKLNTLLASNPKNPDFPKDLLMGYDFKKLITLLEDRQAALRKSTPIAEKFIIPGEAGVLAAAQADVTRTVCRRAERQAVAYRDESGRQDLEELLIYLNRASDYLFVLGRYFENKT